MAKPEWSMSLYVGFKLESFEFRQLWLISMQALSILPIVCQSQSVSRQVSLFG